MFPSENTHAHFLRTKNDETELTVTGTLSWSRQEGMDAAGHRCWNWLQRGAG